MKILSILVLLSFVLSPISVFLDRNCLEMKILSTFAGNTYNWKHTKRSDSGKTFLAKDGTSKGIKNGKSRSGGWEVRGV
jgi:hypothetical protein